MAFKNAGKDIMLNALRAAGGITHASLHTAFPANDANEVAGGAPAYARQAVAFNPASGGTMDDSTNGATFNVPAGSTVAAVGFYTASTAGTILADADVTDETFAAQGTYSLTDADLSITG